MSENKNFEEEYQYVEEGEPSLASAEAVVGTGDIQADYENKLSSLLHQPNVKRNSIIVIVGLFLLISLIKCSSNKQVPTQKSMVIPAPVTKPVSAPTITSDVSNIKASDLTNVITAQKAMQNTLMGVSDQMAQLNIHLTTQDKSYETLQKLVEDLQSKQNANSILIQEILTQLKTRPVMTKPEMVAHKPKYEMPHIDYFVQAVIPGRAWLVNEKGQAITVRVGSEVPGYGMVKDIDAPEGRVVMSTSKVFRFKHDD